tara:strand:- start:3289 stop:3918 length:630 start_codon:yes stop_codon:yes gene_type:complete
MSLPDIQSILENMSNQIVQIKSGVDELNTKVGIIETRVKELQTSQPPQTQIAMVTTISSSEEKIKLLNEQTKSELQEDLVAAIKTRCIIADSGVHSILEQNITIYDYIVDIIYEIDNESSSKYIYGFTDSKNNLYYWNHSKKTWSKLTKTYLHEIFMEIQQKIIIKYNELMNKDDKLKKGCVENGDLIFTDDFEKRHGDFKKSLISKFV